MNVALEAPDHTTLSRRSQHLDVRLHLVPANEPIHLIVDRPGLSIVGEGEWAAVKHGGRGRRGWKKLHFGVDGSGAIVAHVLTDGSADDATTGIDLIEAVEGTISRFTADGAYDTIAIYEAAGVRSATVVVPPTKTAAVSRRSPRAAARDHTILRITQVGRRQWKKERVTTSRLAWRTPSSGTSQSSAAGFALDTPWPRRPKRRSRATSSIA